MNKTNNIVLVANNRRKIKKVQGAKLLVLGTVLLISNLNNSLISSLSSYFLSSKWLASSFSKDISLSGSVDSSFLLYANADLNFISLGNWGYQSAYRQDVMNTLKKKAREESITYILSPGSNFAGGVTNANDSKWQDLFEKQFSDDLTKSLKVPFFTVLGHEDWTGNYTAEITRSHDAFEASNRNKDTSYPIWTLPNYWYHYVTPFAVSSGPNFVKSGHKDMAVAFVFIDTFVLSYTFPFINATKTAWIDLKATLSNAAKAMDYIIVVGDKALYSSSSSKGDSSLRYYLEPLLIKYNVDAYISGNDYSLEMIQKGNITHINCGSAAINGGFELSKISDSLYYTGNPGFCVHQLTATGMITKLIDGVTGEELFTKKHQLQKRSQSASFSPLSEAPGTSSQLPKVEYFPIPMIERTLGSRDTFVKVIGTIGMAILSIFVVFGLFIGASKATKH